MKKLRVALMMRGSTTKQSSAAKKKKQMKSGKKSAREIQIEDDLPLQKITMMNFIETQPEKHLGKEWEFCGLEFIENGVSGFHTHSSKRKGLIDAYQAAKNDEYDILLLFKLDRFGRRSSESLNYALKFLKQTRIWVVDKAKEFTNNGDAEEIMNFIEFWSAKKASQDTKVRVENAMKLIHQEGVWTGGNPPYGFENDPDESNHLKAIPEEAEIVKYIFDQYVNQGNGFTKIASNINEKGIKSKTGRNWSANTIRKILMNSVYKGHLSYGKTKVVEGEFGSYQKALKNGSGHVSEKYWQEYDLVGSEIWEKAQKLRTARVKPNMFGGNQPSRNKTGKGLLVGVLKCECGGHMTYGTSADWADSKRTIKKEPYGIYRCQTRLKQGVKACGAKKATYRVIDLEAKIIDKLVLLTSEMIESKTIEKIRENTKAASDNLKEKIDAIKQELNQLTKAKNNINTKLQELMMGIENGFNQNQLTEIYETTMTKLTSLEKTLAEYESLRSADDLSEIDEIKLEEFISNWRSIFEFGGQEQKRNLIQAIVKEIQVTKDKIKITTAFDIPKFFEAISSIKETAASSEFENISYQTYDDNRGSDCNDKSGMAYQTYDDDRDAYGNDNASIFLHLSDKEIHSLSKKLSKIFTDTISNEFFI